MTSASINDLHRLTSLRTADLAIQDRGEDVRGRIVRDEGWNTIGRVSGLVVDPVERRVRLLEIASGGFLGLGRRTALVPLESISHIGGDAVSIRSGTSARPTSPPVYDPELTERVAASRPPAAVRPAWPTYWPYYTADWPYGPGPRPPA